MPNKKSLFKRCQKDSRIFTYPPICRSALCLIGIVTTALLLYRVALSSLFWLKKNHLATSKFTVLAISVPWEIVAEYILKYLFLCTYLQFT